MTHRLRRLLLPLAGIPLLVVFAAPAWAGWTTLDGGDPVQFDHVCHDGISWDWAHLQWPADEVGTSAENYARTWELFNHPSVPLYNNVHEAPDTDVPDLSAPIMTASTAVPYNPTTVPGFDSASQVHLLEGHLGVHLPKWQTSAKQNKLWISEFWNETVHDCYLYARVAVESAPSPFVRVVALLGTSHLDVSTLSPSSFRLRATGTTVSDSPAPGSSALYDVNGDGRQDLVLRFPVTGTGITASTTSVRLSGLTATGGVLTGTASLG